MTNLTVNGVRIYFAIADEESQSMNRVPWNSTDE